VSIYRAGEHLCGAPGIVHGGIVATLIDEVSCAASVFVRGLRVVTGELSVRYVKPCPVEQDIEIRARIVEERPRYLIVDCVVSLDAVVLARSTGRFFPINAPRGR
jgi:acyl-coenzyme A thioesterase PaaI-like protein